MFRSPADTSLGSSVCIPAERAFDLLTSCPERLHRMPVFERLTEREADQVRGGDDVRDGMQLGYCFKVKSLPGHEHCSSACERGAHYVWYSHHPSWGVWPVYWTVSEMWRQELAVITGRDVPYVSYCSRPIV